MQSPRKGKNPFEFLAKDVQCENEFSQVNLSQKAETSSFQTDLTLRAGRENSELGWICQGSRGGHAQGGRAEHTEIQHSCAGGSSTSQGQGQDPN